jgi:hypothetical protein
VETKPAVKSLTIVGGAGAILVQTLIGAGWFPAEAAEPANASINSIMEIVRNVLAIVAIYGARRAAGGIGNVLK